MPPTLPPIPPTSPLATGTGLEFLRQRQAETTAYAASRGQESYNMLFYSRFGTGKTHFAATGKGPFYWYSFDPGGTKIPMLEELAAKNMAILDTRYETETWEAPFAFELFDKQHEAMKKAGAYNNIGTVVIDSLTHFHTAVMGQWLKSQGRAGKVPQIPDYMMLANTLQQVIKDFCNLPCDFILIGHVDSTRDELSGRLESGLLCWGSSKNVLPTMFDEVLMPCAITGQGKTPAFKVQIYSDGKFNCSSRRFSGPKFEIFEEPDLKKLFAKANRKNAMDLPPLA